jgi:hypothetical protein
MARTRKLTAKTERWIEKVCEDFVLESHQMMLLRLCGEAWDRSRQARATVAVEGCIRSDGTRRNRASPRHKDRT